MGGWETQSSAHRLSRASLASASRIRGRAAMSKIANCCYDQVDPGGHWVSFPIEARDIDNPVKATLSARPPPAGTEGTTVRWPASRAGSSTRVNQGAGTSYGGSGSPESEMGRPLVRGSPKLAYMMQQGFGQAGLEPRRVGSAT